MDKNRIRSMLEELSERRAAANAAKDELDSLKAEFDLETKNLRDGAAELARAVSQLEQDIRVATLELYAQSPEDGKSPVDGVQVAESTIVDFDVSEALSWAKEKGMALTLDASSFKKLAKSGAADDIPATVEKKLIVKISRSI